MKSRKRIAAVLCFGAALGGGALAAAVSSGPESIAFPQDYQKWTLYSTVDRYDSKQYRELYTSAEAVKAVREGRPIPDGTVIVMAIHSAKVDDKSVPVKDAKGRFVKERLTGVTVMEKRKGAGASVPEEWRNGDWQYASFTHEGKPNEKANANIKNCFVCHKPHEKQDFVISLAQLAGKFPSGPVAMKAGMHDVNINGFTFGPAVVKVPAGQPVTWINGDDSPHQVTVAGDKPIRTAVLLKGQTATLTFDQAGTLSYICGLHPAMKGSIEVTNANVQK
jgi:plastocyanin